MIGQGPAPGRIIAEYEFLFYDTNWGCSISPFTKLAYATYHVLLLNSTFLLLPFVLFILIRGWFFDKSWRKKRLRNTIVVLMVFFMVFGFMPMPTHAQAASSEIGLWFMDHVKERLAKMYGHEDLIPPGKGAAASRQVMPPFENAALLRDAALYFVPGKYRHEIEGAYTRTASLFGSGDTPVAVTQASMNQGSGDTPVAGPGPEGDKSVSPTSLARNNDEAVRGVGDPTRASADSSTSASTSAESDRSILSSAFNILSSLFGPSEAQAALTGDLADADSIRFYHTDHLGSVRIITDGDGDIFETIDYQPFGELMMDSMTNDYRQERHKFTGQMFDYSTGLYYYGARHYDPETGRFTQADTIVPEPLDGQAFNRYTYVNNNPFKYTDPSGHGWMVIIPAIIEFIASVIAVSAMAYIVSNAIMSAVTGTNTMSGEGLASAVGGGFLSLIPGVREIMFAYSMIQLCVAIHNGQGGQAALGLACGLIGGYLAGYTRFQATQGDLGDGGMQPDTPTYGETGTVTIK